MDNMYELYHGDCLEILPGMSRVPCIFADPPDGIGLKYEGFDDRIPEFDYVKLLEDWLYQFVKQADTVWFSFNAKWTISMGGVAQRVMEYFPGMTCKPCVQTFSFGQHNQRDFGNNHRPLWRFRHKDAPIYPNQIRVQSDRQKMGDKRADPRGRVPGDVAEFELGGRECLPLPNWSPRDIERFLAKIQRGNANECWPWTGSKREGYGRFRVGGHEGKVYTSTRLMWRLTHGTDPAGQLVCHACDNPACCNPSHLFLGSDAENNVDKEVKKRGKHPIGISNGLSKLGEEDVVAICMSTGSHRSLAKEYGVSDVAIAAIRNGKTWTHITDKLNMGSVFRFTRVTGNSKQRRKWHKTQLNEGLVERCIKSCTQEGDVVIDPFAGTGTTLRVCKRLNRACVTMDISSFYCQQIADEHHLEIRSA